MICQKSRKLCKQINSELISTYKYVEMSMIEGFKKKRVKIHFFSASGRTNRQNSRSKCLNLDKRSGKISQYLNSLFFIKK